MYRPETFMYLTGFVEKPGFFSVIASHPNHASGEEMAEWLRSNMANYETVPFEYITADTRFVLRAVEWHHWVGMLSCIVAEQDAVEVALRWADHITRRTYCAKTRQFIA